MGPRRVSRLRPHGSKGTNVQEWYSIQNKNVFFILLKRARKCIIHAGKGINLHKNSASSQTAGPSYIRGPFQIIIKKQRLISRNRKTGRCCVYEVIGMRKTGKKFSARECRKIMSFRLFPRFSDDWRNIDPTMGKIPFRPSVPPRGSGVNNHIARGFARTKKPGPITRARFIS